jgi:Spy/CpxP family protein refolding chaperone
MARKRKKRTPEEIVQEREWRVQSDANLRRLRELVDRGWAELEEPLWQTFVDALESQFRDRMHGGARPGLGHARQWATDLNLSDQQRDQIRTAVRSKFEGQREQMKEQWKASREQGHQMLESFRQDQFTLDANSPELFGRDRIAGGVGKMIDFAEAAVPTLTPEQRAIAAQKIRTQEGHF